MKTKVPRLLIVMCLLSIFYTFSGCGKKNPPPSTVNLKKGLLLYLPFNGSFADSSGNANPSVNIAGAALSTDAKGNANSAFVSTGNGECIVVTNNGSVKFDTAFTTSFNAMVVLEQRIQIFLSLAQYSTAYGEAFNCGLNTPGDEQFNFGVGDITGGCDHNVGSNPYDVTDSTGFHPVSGQWYNIICAYHRGTITTYVNGRQVSSKTNSLGTLALNCPDAQFIIGGFWQKYPESLKGKMDEVRFYNRLLNADEIKELSKDFQQN